MEDILVTVIALWFSAILMWIWCFSLHKRMGKLEDVNEVLPESEEEDE